MKRLILLAFVAVALPALPEDSGPRKIAVTLPMSDIHEECMTLKAGEMRSYEWKSDVSVDFNIHYHHEPKIFFPVKKDHAKSAQGKFTAKSDEGYCWMWTAGKAPAKIEGTIE
jgi:hypothetical protein